MGLPLTQIQSNATAAAARTGVPHAVLNLNRAGLPLYVVRDMEGAPFPFDEACDDLERRNGRGYVVSRHYP